LKSRMIGIDLTFTTCIFFRSGGDLLTPKLLPKTQGLSDLNL